MVTNIDYYIDVFENLSVELNQIQVKEIDKLKIFVQKLESTIKNALGENCSYSKNYDQNDIINKFITNKQYYAKEIAQKSEIQWNIGNDYLVKFIALILMDLRQQKANQLNIPNIDDIVVSKIESIKSLIGNPEENDFLNESLKCYKIGALRATIIMIWNLTVNHLYDYILLHEKINFNRALAANTDKRVKVTSIKSKDDFFEIPEGKFIEFCRNAFITNDIRKILDEKLGIRNSYAHPSNITIDKTKVDSFIIDLLKNIVLRYVI